MLPIMLGMWAIAGWQAVLPLCTYALAASWTLVQLGLVLVVDLERRSLRGFESLRPVSRERLVRQWAVGVLWRLAAGLALGGVCLVVAWAINLIWPGVRELSLVCLLTAALLAHTAIVVLLRTYGSDLFQGIAGLVVTALLVVVVVSTRGATMHALPTWAIFLFAAVVAAASVAIFRIAYRRWLAIDLD